ncbi:MAG: hypothetical protein L3J49_13280 [Desulfobulbaceae bacterium]|nr:hypothetical protein [Desulfobulbaceae bacterium]
MKIQAIVVSCLLLVASQNSFAEQGDISLAVKGGTLGIGGEAGIALTDDFVLRGGVNYLKFDFDSTISDIDYTMEPEFKNGSLLLDWHPFSGSFRLTGGLYFNGNEVNVDGTYRRDLLPAEFQQYAGLVRVKGTVDFNSIAPYAGLGWNSNHGQKGWGIAFDVGVMFQGSPNVSDLYVEAPININGQPEVVRFLDEQKKAIEDDLDPFQYYPVASLTVSYNF